MENEDVLHNTAPQIITEDEEATLSQATGGLGPNTRKGIFIGYNASVIPAAIVGANHMAKDKKEGGTLRPSTMLEGGGILVGGTAVGGGLGYLIDKRLLPPVMIK